MSVEVTQDNTQVVVEGIKAAIERSLEKIGLKAEGDAQDLCPVDTGRLKDSITHVVDGGAKEVAIGTNVEYGKYVELGTRSQSAQPFLRPAAEANGGQYALIVKGELQGS